MNFRILKNNAILGVTTSMMKAPILTLRYLLFGILFVVTNGVMAHNFEAPSVDFIPTLPQDRSEDSDNDSEDELEIESGGIISTDELVCSDAIPAGIKNVTSPSGDIEGFLIIKWEKKIASGPWTEIPGATTLDYFPGPIVETTQYRRACRESIHQPWKYSNIVTKTIVPAIENVTVSLTNITCKGGKNGQASANVTGGTPGYTYEWSTGDSEAEVSDLTAGTYWLKVIDANECAYETNIFTLIEPEFSVEAEEIYSFEPTCPGMSNGAIFVEAFYGEPPYTFEWSNGNTGNANFDIPSGEYEVTVVDALGCSNKLTGLTLDEPEEFKLVDNTRSVTCFGKADGATEIEAGGGTAPYNYFWPDGSNAQLRTDLAAGVYTIGVTDYNGCYYTENITIAEPDPLDVDQYTVNNKICNASINAVPVGGTAPYTFEWDNGSTQGFITGLCPGEYTVEITDVNGCMTTETMAIGADYATEDISVQLIVNPYSGGSIVIKLPFEDEVDVRIYNTSGQLIEVISDTDKHANADQELQIDLDLNKYSNGYYLIAISTGGLSLTEKVVITK